MSTGLFGFSKQPSEKFYVAGEFRKVLEYGETLVLASCTVAAEDKDAADMGTTVLDQATKAVDGTQLKIRCQAGAENKSPYKITFLATTSNGNVWEVDVEMEIEET